MMKKNYQKFGWFCLFLILTLILLSIIFTACLWNKQEAVRILYGIVSVNEKERFLLPRGLTVSAYFSELFDIAPGQMKVDLEGYWKEEDLPEGRADTFNASWGSGTYTDEETVQEIINILSSVEYEIVEIEPDDYEIVDITFLNAFGAEYKRVVLAYRYADRQLYAFYGKNCYLIRDTDAFREYWQQRLSIPELYYFHTYKTGAMWIDSYFRKPFLDERSELIWSGFLCQTPHTTVTSELIREKAFEEIKNGLQITWPPELLSRIEEYHDGETVSINDDGVLYDRYNKIWRVYVHVYYPAEFDDGGYRNCGYRIGFTTVSVFFDQNAVTKCIWDMDKLYEKYSIVQGTMAP